MKKYRSSILRPFRLRLAGLCAVVLLVAVEGSVALYAAESSSVTAMVNEYCLDCHQGSKAKGDLDFDKVRLDSPPARPEVWEKVVRKLAARQMPPVGKDRPDANTFQKVLAELTASLDQAAKAQPNPGRTDTFRRLNRTEYQNAIRDLLGVEIDAAALLPKDEASHGFDNVTVANLSPTLLERYITAAQKVSRLAIGAPRRTQGGDTFRLRPDLTQEEHIDGLPLGTRGGVLLPYTFPRDGEYEIQVRLTRDRNEEVEGLHGTHELEVLLDRERVKLLTVSPPPQKDYEAVDRHLKVRVQVKAGLHNVGVTFLKNPTPVAETKRQPYNAHFNMHRHPRQTPAVYQVSINGPYDSKSPGDSPSRRLIFVSTPKGPADEEASAKEILARLIRKAYRRPVTEAELSRPLEFFRAGRAEGGYEAGIEMAISSILISPQFLFRVEHDPAEAKPGAAYRISDLDLATRLSFFLWSSIPDNELLDAAVAGKLHEPAVLEKQVRRMLADKRAETLATNFADQWLYLRNLETITPDLRLFPDFDDNLRQAFRQETELFFESLMREDRSVMDLLRADYTFLNERLAKHYGIPHIYGSRFRRVALDKESGRGGLLRQGSILTVTSYATRTSPVIRGHWILGNLMGSPPPPPPADVPALKDNTVSSSLPMRARLAEHRANVACASCHNVMDPVGFAMENFDAVGRWRTVEDGVPIDATGSLPDGTTFNGVTGLEDGLLKQPELFVGTMAEKMLTYALGRGVEHYDAPAVREIVRESRTNNYRFSAVVLGIVKSTPFTMRKAL